MIRKLRASISLQIAFTVSVLLLLANAVLGFVLVNQSKESMKSQINTHMLDITNCAADMIDGDALEKLQANDIGTAPYQKVNDALVFFRDNIELEYIYTVRDEGNDRFVFMVDPTLDDPGEFGEPVVTTEALKKSRQGNCGC